ncbi:cytochrome P450 2U1-like [Glandiceps talaboti]
MSVETSAEKLQELFSFLDLTTSLIFLGVFLTTFYLCRRPNNLPPGPFGWPLLGNLLSLSEHMYLDFDKMAAKYGSVFTLKFGPTTAIILHGYDAVYQAYVRQAEDFSDRPSIGIFEKLIRDPEHKDSGGERGSLFFERHGLAWKARRRFMLNAYRYFNVRSTLEAKVQEEIMYYLNTVKQKCGQPFCPETATMNAVTNITCSSIFGARFEYNDADFQEIVRVAVDIVREIGPTSIGNFLPFVCDIPFMYKKVKHMVTFLRTKMKGMISDHKKTLDRNSPRDIIDLYLIENQKEREKADNKPQVFCERYLWRAVLDLFEAGSETTSATLLWMFLYVAINKDSQRKVQNEIDDVIGRDRQPSWSDRDKLPYTIATINEVLRLANVPVYGTPHCASNDTTLFNYFIPKGTLVMASFWSVHHDEKYWKEPYTFRPERFLDDNGNVVNRDAFLPFSAGPRSCLGKQLAKMIIFLVFVNVLRKFNLELPVDDPSPNMMGVSTITRCPDTYRLSATMR